MILFDHIKRLLPFGLLVFFLPTVMYGASTEALKAKLDRARENLRISEATEARIAAEIVQLKKSGKATSEILPEILKDYEIYLERVRAMVIENRELVREIEARYLTLEPPKGPSGTARSVDRGRSVDPDRPIGRGREPYVKLPDEKDYDELAALDRSLDDSLAAFDEMLLKELDEIRLTAADRMRDLAEEAAAAAKRLREKGVVLNTSSAESTPDREEDPGNQKKAQMPAETGEVETRDGALSPEQGKQDSEAPTTENRQAKAGEAGRGQSTAQDPKTRPDGHDDDIVARQLREAAEKETDPELKEKLWKEYEDYKRGETH